MLVVFSQVAPMRRMMKKLMQSMPHWTRGWMKDAKKGGLKTKLFEQSHHEILFAIKNF